MRELFFIAVVLACPLMMIFMMRGGHGHGGGCAGHSNSADLRDASADELRRRRDELNGLIDARERVESPEPERELMPSDGGGR